ncbi:hypothetical protein IG193_08910 [Infirmifilum lucidum]|uniref:Uncharacterized protein n=1 Tax=Infirmifilum lucidum TaxID=2776706 RepID=A0A7L9FGG4_9CREN|nr:hypothetical protein [Infirmifilum lucidum]QOJ78849.1 hypothetical protein IG193_08910 [Infirmifilum lucidum]
MTGVPGQRLVISVLALLMFSAAAFATTCSRGVETWSAILSAHASITGSSPYSATGYAAGVARGTDLGCILCPLLRANFAIITLGSEFERPRDSWGLLCPGHQARWSSTGAIGSWVYAYTYTPCGNKGVEVTAFLSGYCATSVGVEQCTGG